MLENETKAVPTEREQEIAWMQQHLDIFWELASEGCQESGRGVLVADLEHAVDHEGTLSHPLMYVPQPSLHEIPWTQEQAIVRLVKEYDPSWEFIAVLLKGTCESVYRLGVYVQDDNTLSMRQA